MKDTKQRNFQVYQGKNGKGLIKAWVNGVTFEEKAREQVLNAAAMPFIHKWVALMPDVHCGIGATIGSVIPTKKAIIPAAVGVDIGCGMMAVRTSLTAGQLPDNLKAVRSAIEKSCPHGMTKGKNRTDRGSWGTAPDSVEKSWAQLDQRFQIISEKNPLVATRRHPMKQLGTLGTGNHFIEVCLDESDRVWFMLHSGSRGIGNRIGSYFIEKAKKDMEKWQINLPDKNLAYFPEGTDHFDEYFEAVGWAQDYARMNRQTMMDNLISRIRKDELLPPFTLEKQAVNCHHNYVERENHYGENVLVTRKGAVRARLGDLGIIPGSMGTRSYIVRGKGNEESFCSCSHGAGRVMSRGEAFRKFTVDDHKKATAGIECRKDKAVIDETPMAYKDIDAVMEAQKDLVDIVHTLRQVVCVKG